jgi:hypothetical protein
MNTNPSHQKKDPGIDLISEDEVQESIFPTHHEVNITEGGEFLDDAIRMKDQPFRETNKTKE